jgi:hypothetical protein
MWTLNSQQYISVDQRRNVHFTHSRGKGITLSWRQFLNLNDIIKDLTTFHNMKYYPLGSNVWLQYYNQKIQLYNCVQYNYFSFDKECWRKYIKECHLPILSFLRYDSKAIRRRQHAPTHANLFQSGSHSITPTTSKQQVLSGPTSNAGSENEQCTESPNISKWNSTNSRRPFSFISEVHALRTAKNATADMEEGEVFDFKSDCGQYSDFCSIE